MKRFLPLCLAMAMLLSFTGCSNNSAGSPSSNTSSSSGTEQKVYEFRFASNTKTSELERPGFGSAIMMFADKLEEKTNGQIKLQFFPDAQLGSSAEEIIGGCQNGSFELFNLSLGSWGEYTDAFAPMSIPYLLVDQEQAYRFVDGEIGQKMIEEALKDTGMRVIAFLDIGFRNVTSNNGFIKTPDDMKGLKIRTQTDNYMIAAMEALGASVVPMGYSELYTALQQKLVDAQENPIVNICTAKFYEVQDYLTLTKHTYTLTCIAMDNEVFTSLPSDLQEAILELGREATQKSRDDMEAQAAEDLATLAQHMEIYEPTQEELLALQEVASSSWSIIKKDLGDEYFDQIVNAADEALKG